MAELRSAPFSEREFRDALGFFVTGITVVTARTSEINLATAVSSFNAVSLEPPLVLFSIARKAVSFAAWQRVEAFAVMVLSERQSDVSNRFAKSGSDKWQGTVPQLGKVGALLLRIGWRASNVPCTTVRMGVIMRSSSVA